MRPLRPFPFPNAAVRNTYEAIRGGTSLDPDKATICFLPEADPEEAPQVTTHGKLWGRIHQTANLLHDLGVGPTDVVSYLLPLVPQSYFVLFGGHAAGIDVFAPSRHRHGMALSIWGGWVLFA